MNITDALIQSPQYIQDSPVVQAMTALMQNQAGQIQQQAGQIQNQVEQIATLKEAIECLKDEISRLNKTPKRPKFRPNQLEPRSRGKKGKDSRGSSSKSNKNICAPDKKQEEIRVQAKGVPQGARFKGYAEFKMQELEIIVKEVTYKLEIWQSPDGKMIRARLPKELQGKHFGPQLSTLVINFYAQGMTQPAIHDFLQGIGITISTGQISHILLREADGFGKVSEEILEAGLQEAPYIRTDDTGARHKHQNGYCTHIGGEHFAYYKTTFSKSRENFLGILLQGREGYKINEAMIWHLFESGVKDDILNLFEQYRGRKYKTKRGFNRFLNTLCLGGKKLRVHCLEGALVGFISEEILKEGQILLSDRAGQFAVFDHAACWVHMERPLRKIPVSSDLVKSELNLVRGTIWELYDKLKESALSQTCKDEVKKDYDTLTMMKSTSPAIQSVIDNFREYRDEMLKMLEHPYLPPHNNDSERDIRGFVKRRKISGSTKSEQGRKFRDGLASLKQTCFRLGLSFWKYSSEWFQGKPPDLAQLIRKQYQVASLP